MNIPRTFARCGQALTTLVIFIGLIFAGQQPAHAEQWAFGHGWNGDRSLYGSNYARHGKAVGLWKNILVATFGCGSVNMESAPAAQQWYGDAEQWFTHLWQQRYHVPAPDGVVGPNTWAAARWFNLKFFESNGDYEYYGYTDAITGRTLPFAFRRYAPWDLWEVEGRWDNYPNGTVKRWFMIDSSYERLGDVTWHQICHP